jgi:protein-tyrosine-phosphatase
VKPSGVRPEAIAVMRELGIDLSGQRSKHVSEFSGEGFDYVLTVCDNARENCPIFPGGPISIHHNFVDPQPSAAPRKNASLSSARFATISANIYERSRGASVLIQA